MHPTPRRWFSAIALLLVLASPACGDNESRREVAREDALGVVSGFALLASKTVSVDDRTATNPQISGGDVGAAGIGVAANQSTLVIGSDARVDTARVLIGQRTVLRDRATVGTVSATTITAPFAHYTSQIAFSAPPAPPAIGSFTVGTAAVTVNSGQTVQLAAGKRGAVTVNGALELTGGLYEFASLTVGNDARFTARARSVVRIAQGLRGLDRVRITVVAPLNAGDLRFIVAGVNAGTTSSALFGNDANITGLFLGSAGMTAGDRLTALGAIVGRDVTLGHDAKVTFQSGFTCNADATCADTNTCTADSCTDGQCVNTVLPNGTGCSDANGCTQTDACQAGVCVGGNVKVCSAIDQCHVAGTCAPATGLCSNPNKADGTTCNDSNACTQTDACQAGACVGATPVVCSALDQCHVKGTCDPATGACSNPNGTDGTACSDALACTLGDTCQAGACVGAAQTCSTPTECDAIGPCAVQPTVSCVLLQEDGTYVAMFGYQNGASSAVQIPVGPTNQFSPVSADQGQPTSFKPGSLDYWVVVPFNGSSVTWSLGGRSATATTSSPACPPFAGGDDDTESSGDLAKVVPLGPGEVPDATLIPKVQSDNLFPLVNVPVVDYPEPLMASQFESDASGDDDFGTILKLVDLSLPDQGTTRYVETVLVNSTNQVLSFVEGEFQGAAVDEPPSGISGISYGRWQSKNGKALQGTGGHMTYGFAGGNKVTVVWNNPWIGPNSYGFFLSGPTAANFAVNRVGGGGNQADVFFILRDISTPATTCPFGTHQWAVDRLRVAEEPLGGFATATGFFTTPLKNISGIGKWEGTGCVVNRAVGRVVATAHSTDRFFTIDVILDEFDGDFLTDSGKAVRIEVSPAGSLGLMTNPAHKAIVNDGLPSLGSRIQFSGRLLIDHGSFLEVHPSDPIQTAKPCDQFGPTEPLPLYCNKVLNDFFDWTTGQPPTPMGRADNRACFITRMTGDFSTPQDEIHALIDPATNNWFLTGQNGTHQSVVVIPGVFPSAMTNAEAAAALGIPVDQVVSAQPGLIGVNVTIIASNVTSAQARCITVRSLSAEGTWNQGDAPVNIGSNLDACFLTRVAGNFAGSGESVQVLVQAVMNTNAQLYTVLEGSSQHTGVSASARCTSPSQAPSLIPSIWNQGDATVEMKSIESFPACYLTSVGGAFRGTGEKVEIRAATFNGHLHWTLGGTSAQSGVFAFSECMKP
jgi:hypothetical protein